MVDYQKRLAEIASQIAQKIGKIEALERRSFITIFKKLIGDHTKTLELYEQHYLDLSLEFNALNQSIELVNYEIGILEAKLTSLKSQKQKFKLELTRIENAKVPIELKGFQKVLKEQASIIRLIKELGEAVKEGESINRKFNSAIRFVKKLALQIYDQEKDVKKMNEYNIEQVDKLQAKLVIINHSFIKYQSEVDDVYREILKNNTHSNAYLKNFMERYRESLVSDLRKAKGLNYTFDFLKKYKEIIMALNRSMRSDIKKCKNKLEALEKEEVEIFGKLE